MGWLKDLQVNFRWGVKDWNKASDASISDLIGDDRNGEGAAGRSSAGERAAGGCVRNGLLYLGGMIIPVKNITGVSLSHDGRKVSIDTAGGTTEAEGNDARSLYTSIKHAMPGGGETRW